MKNLVFLLALIVLPGCDKIEEWWLSTWYPNSVILVDRCMQLNKSQLSVREQDDIKASCAAKYEKPIAFHEVKGTGRIDCQNDRPSRLNIRLTNHSDSIITRFNAYPEFFMDKNEDSRKASFFDRMKQQSTPDLSLWIAPRETREVMIPLVRGDRCSELEKSVDEKGFWWGWSFSKISGVSTDVR